MHMQIQLESVFFGKIRADSEQNEQMPIGPTQATGEGSQAGR